MLIEIVATACAGLFTGAAIYINVVEHPARLECGTDVAVKEFAPSYRRATIMQAPLALLGLAAAVAAWWRSGDSWVLAAGLLLGSVVPFTLVVILPTNKRLLDAQLDPASAQAASLLHPVGQVAWRAKLDQRRRVPAAPHSPARAIERLPGRAELAWFPGKRLPPMSANEGPRRPPRPRSTPIRAARVTAGESS